MSRDRDSEVKAAAVDLIRLAGAAEAAKAFAWALEWHADGLEDNDLQQSKRVRRISRVIRRLSFGGR